MICSFYVHFEKFNDFWYSLSYLQKRIVPSCLALYTHLRTSHWGKHEYSEIQFEDFPAGKFHVEALQRQGISRADRRL
jgi:hypothetical protein